MNANVHLAESNHAGPKEPKERFFNEMKEKIGQCEMIGGMRGWERKTVSAGHQGV
jgi:hypothetical protein